MCNFRFSRSKYTHISYLCFAKECSVLNHLLMHDYAPLITECEREKRHAARILCTPRHTLANRAQLFSVAICICIKVVSFDLTETV